MGQRKPVKRLCQINFCYKQLPSNRKYCSKGHRRLGLTQGPYQEYKCILCYKPQKFICICDKCFAEMAEYKTEEELLERVNQRVEEGVKFAVLHRLRHYLMNKHS